MCYKAMDVAQYVINHSIDNASPISNLKLQKLLYYVQAAFLVEKGEPCFSDDLKNWRHGPVVPVVYSEYKRYLNNVIKDRQTGFSQLTLDENINIIVISEEYSESKFKEEDRDLINKVVDALARFKPWELVDRTHREDPWFKDTEGDETISDKYILNYFSKDENRLRIYGEM